jgi:hypothetical protein
MSNAAWFSIGSWLSVFISAYFPQYNEYGMPLATLFLIALAATACAGLVYGCYRLWAACRVQLFNNKLSEGSFFISLFLGTLTPGLVWIDSVIPEKLIGMPVLWILIPAFIAFSYELNRKKKGA